MTLPETHKLVKLPASIHDIGEVSAVAQPLSDLGPNLLFLVTIFSATMSEIGCGAGRSVEAAASNAVDDVVNRRIKARWFDPAGVMTDTRNSR